VDLVDRGDSGDQKDVVDQGNDGDQEDLSGSEGRG
jgi:hypothetical protein